MDSQAHARTLEHLTQTHAAIFETARETTAEALAEFDRAMRNVAPQVEPPTAHLAPESDAG